MGGGGQGGRRVVWEVKDWPFLMTEAGGYHGGDLIPPMTLILPRTVVQPRVYKGSQRRGGRNGKPDLSPSLLTYLPWMLC